jgi:hypothetical protein
MLDVGISDVATYFLYVDCCYVGGNSVQEQCS